jgi:hypothetical protein
MVSKGKIGTKILYFWNWLLHKQVTCKCSLHPENQEGFVSVKKLLSRKRENTKLFVYILCFILVFNFFVFTPLLVVPLLIDFLNPATKV